MVVIAKKKGQQEHRLLFKDFVKISHMVVIAKKKGQQEHMLLFKDFVKIRLRST